MKPAAVAAFAFLLALAAPAHARRAERGAGEVPHLDVATSCRDAKIYGMSDPEQTYKNCMLDEKEARRKLEENWSKYKLSTKEQCHEPVPSPSYVELLTCIEMTEEILKPTMGGGPIHVPGGALGSPPQRPLPSPGPRAMPR